MKQGWSDCQINCIDKSTLFVKPYVHSPRTAVAALGQSANWWCALPYHPVWDGRVLHRALHDFNTDDRFRSRLNGAFGRVVDVTTRTAWKIVAKPFANTINDG